jgi:hypothetical protein
MFTVPNTQAARRSLIREAIDRTPRGFEFTAPDTELMRRLTGAPAGARFRHMANPHDPTAVRYVQLFLVEPFIFPGRRRAHVAGWDDWSWIKAFENQHRVENGKTPKDHERENDFSALRDAVAAEIAAARVGLGNSCALCEATEVLQVDHAAPPFVVIAEEFRARGAVVLTARQGTEDVMADPAQIVAWRAFHAERATYQLLCRSCNARKGAR